MGDLLTVSANLTGTPALNIPYGWDADENLPQGIQLSAAHFGEFIAVANFGASAFNSMNLNNNISNQPTFDSRDRAALDKASINSVL